MFFFNKLKFFILFDKFLHDHLYYKIRKNNRTNIYYIYSYFMISYLFLKIIQRKIILTVAFKLNSPFST